VLSRPALLTLTLIVLVGCASATPTPLSSIEPLVGQWQGTLDQGEGPQLFYLTINPSNGKPELFMDDTFLSFHAVVTKLP